MPPKKTTIKAMKVAPKNKTQKASVIVAVNSWYNVPVDKSIFGEMPVLDDSNMNVTYVNRRDHLTDWMIRLLLQNPNKVDFKICNQKSGTVKVADNFLIKDDIYLSTIPKNAAAIKTLNFVDYYAFDYGNETDVMKNQIDAKFLNSPKFVFNDGNYVDVSKYDLHQMNASGNENSCGFFAGLQAISPLYRALNYPAKLFITHEFRNNYVPTIIVNEKGAPMSTKDYKTPSMGGDATTNELDVIRAKYNEYDSETSAKHKFMEYLNGSQKGVFTGISMHIRNSWFFGFNVVSISARTQNSVTGKYKFFKDEIEGPEKVNDTIFICNKSSAHYMTIGIENAAGKIDFVFNEGDAGIKQMIDDISVKGTASDVVKPIEQDLTFENIEINYVSRKILDDQKTGVTIDVILYKPKSVTVVFPRELHFTITGLKMYTDNEITLGNYFTKILCLAFDRINDKYYYVSSYKLSATDPNIETYHVAGIAKNDKKLTIANGYADCGTIQYNNKTGEIVTKLDVCDLPTPPKSTVVAITNNPTVVTTTNIPPVPPQNPTVVAVSNIPPVPPQNPTVVTTTNIPPKTVIPIVPIGPSTCVILVKFKLNNGTLDVDSVNINADANACNSALPFPDDFATIIAGQDYLFTIEYDPANPSVSAVTESKTQLTCDATNNLKQKLDALFAP